MASCTSLVCELITFASPDAYCIRSGAMLHYTAVAVLHQCCNDLGRVARPLKDEQVRRGHYHRSSYTPARRARARGVWV